jgi:hypothetical protein
VPETPRRKFPSAPGIPGVRLPPRIEEERVREEPEQTPPGSSVRPKIVLDLGRGRRLALSGGFLAGLLPLLWHGWQQWEEMDRRVKQAVELAAKCQEQISSMDAKDSERDRERATLAKRAADGEDWTAAVFQQALGVDVRRRDDARPLPQLRVTFPLKRSTRFGPHSPTAIVDTPQPTGP